MLLIKMWPYILGSTALGLDAYVLAGILPDIALGISTSITLASLGVTLFTGFYAISGPLFAGTAGKNSQKALILSLTIFALANLLTAFSFNLGIFLLSRILAGSAAGIFSPLSSTVAASQVTAENKGKALSYILGGLALGTVFGVPLGLMVANIFSWRITISLITLITIISIVGIYFSKNSIPNISSPSLKARLKTLTSQLNLLTITVTLLTGIASLGLYTFISPLLEAKSLANQTTLIIWCWGIGGAIGAFGIGKIVDKYKKSLHITLIILFSLFASFIAIYLVRNIILTCIFIGLWGLFGWASLAPQQYTLLNNNPKDGTTAVAANSSANYLGSSIGSLLGSLLIGIGMNIILLPLMVSIPILLAIMFQIRRMKLKEKLIN